MSLAGQRTLLDGSVNFCEKFVVRVGNFDVLPLNCVCKHTIHKALNAGIGQGYILLKMKRNTL